MYIVNLQIRLSKYYTLDSSMSDCPADCLDPFMAIFLLDLYTTYSTQSQN